MWQLKSLHDSSPCFIKPLLYLLYYYSHIHALNASSVLLHWFLIWFHLATIVWIFSTWASLGRWSSESHAPTPSLNDLGTTRVATCSKPTWHGWLYQQLGCYQHSSWGSVELHKVHTMCCFIYEITMVLNYAGRPTMDEVLSDTEQSDSESLWIIVRQFTRVNRVNF